MRRGPVGRPPAASVGAAPPPRAAAGGFKAAPPLAEARVPPAGPHRTAPPTAVAAAAAAATVARLSPTCAPSPPAAASIVAARGRERAHAAPRAALAETHRPARGHLGRQQGDCATGRGDARAAAAVARGAAVMEAPVPLSRARRHQAVVRALPRGGAQAVAAAFRAWTHLHAVAATDDVLGVAALLAAGADVDGAAEDGRTPLHAAAAVGAVDAAEALLLAGASVDGPEGVAARPIVVALANRQTAVVELLEKYGAAVPDRWMRGKLGVGLLRRAFGQEQLHRRWPNVCSLTKEERHALWWAACTPSNAPRNVAGSADETFAQLRVAHQRFLLTPASLSLPELGAFLAPDLILDARGVWQAHQLLLLALRLGLFATGPRGNLNQLRRIYFRRVYMQARMPKAPYDGRLQRAIIRSARRQWSLDEEGDPFPPETGNVLPETQFSGQLTVVYLRLGLVPAALEGADRRVHDGVDWLRRQWHHRAGWSPRTRREAAVTSVTTIGMGLVPLVVAAFCASGGSTATAAEREAAAAAVDAYWADPADVASARLVLRHAIDAAPRQTASQRAAMARIEASLHRYECLAALDGDLAWVEEHFGVAPAPSMGSVDDQAMAAGAPPA